MSVKICVKCGRVSHRHEFCWGLWLIATRQELSHLQRFSRFIDYVYCRKCEVSHANWTMWCLPESENSSQPSLGRLVRPKLYTQKHDQNRIYRSNLSKVWNSTGCPKRWSYSLTAESDFLSLVKTGLLLMYTYRDGRSQFVLCIITVKCIHF